VIQSDLANATDSVLVMLLTSTVRDAPMYRLSLPASPTTGLQQPSQLMVDKIMAARRDKCGAAIGRIDSEALGALRPLLAFILGMAE
jgi:mRNA interferase MazF